MVKTAIANKSSVVNAPEWAKLDFYAAEIRDAKLGPRRELTLRIELRPERKTSFGDGDVVTLRFGAIANFEEIQRFFARRPVDSLHYLRYSSQSRPRRNIIEMEFDRTEDRVKIVAGNVTLLLADPSP